VLDMRTAHFMARASKPWCCFSRKARLRERSGSTSSNPGRNLGKTNPLNDETSGDFIALQPRFKDSENSWTVDAKTIDKATFDLSVKNPNKADEAGCAIRRHYRRDGSSRCGEREILAGIGRML